MEQIMRIPFASTVFFFYLHYGIIYQFSCFANICLDIISYHIIQFLAKKKKKSAEVRTKFHPCILHERKWKIVWLELGKTGAVRLCLLSRLFGSSAVDFCVVVVVVGVVLFLRCRRIFNILFRVHVPARFAPLLTCCRIRFENAVKSQNDIVFCLSFCWPFLFFVFFFSAPVDCLWLWLLWVFVFEFIWMVIS